jgi:AAA15 family ATPase/GTPase
MRHESDGTRRLLDLAPILYATGEGSADVSFVVDELERSLHPLLTRMLLQLFLARAAEGLHAQLIFTTHDTNLLDLRILSRDSIWLIEKYPRGGSVMYPLSDLDPAQLDEVERQGKGMERGYLQGRFGAIPSFGSLEALGFREEDLR